MIDEDAECECGHVFHQHDNGQECAERECMCNAFDEVNMP